jgi:hypothetical protein
MIPLALFNTATATLSRQRVRIGHNGQVNSVLEDNDDPAF